MLHYHMFPLNFFTCLSEITVFNLPVSPDTFAIHASLPNKF